MRILCTQFMLTVICGLVITGCSGADNLVTPAIIQGSLKLIPANTILNSDCINSITGIIGAYELTLDPDDKEASLVPKRYSNIGESYIVNGMGFFRITPCTDCLAIKAIGMNTNEKILLKMSIRHPFQLGNIEKPPNAKNRLDLDIFDVALVVEPRDMTPFEFPTIGGSIFSDGVSNASGYTTEIAELTGDYSAMPFILVVDDSESGISTWNKFGMGAETVFDVLFSLGNDSSAVFDLYLTMGYGAASTRSSFFDPKYYNPEYNRKSAWKIEAEALAKFYAYDSNPVDILVSVYDWQMGAHVDPELANPSDVVFASEVTQIEVEIPGIGYASKQGSEFESGTGMPGDPLIYSIPLENQGTLGPGEYIGVVKCTDERVPGSIDGIDHLIDNKSPGELIHIPFPEFATYQIFIASVIEVCGPVTGSILKPTCPVLNVLNDSTIDFIVNASSAGTGNPITLYEADFDFNGVDFLADGTNTDGEFSGAGPFSVPNPCSFNTPYTRTVAFRATDSCSPPNVSIFATCDVTVSKCGYIRTITWGGPMLDDVYAVSVDSQGNYYTTGTFKDTVDFGGDIITSNGEEDIFLIKFDVDGNWEWTKTWGGSFWDSGSSLYADSDGNVYVTGHYRGTVDFNPDGGGTHMATGAWDAFLSKFNSAGVWQWTKVWGGEVNSCVSGESVSVGQSGNVFVTGYFIKTVDFNSDGGPDGTHTSEGNYDVFLSKFTPSGTWLWTETWGGPSEDKAYSVSLDQQENPYVGGIYNGPVDFNPDGGQIRQSNNNSQDCWISKLDADGNWQWTSTFGGVTVDMFYSVASDSAGYSYATGSSQGPVDFGDGILREGYGYQDTFLCKFSPNGMCLWGRIWGGDDIAWGRSVALDQNSYVYIAGYFRGDVDFGDGTLRSSVAAIDVFLNTFNSEGDWQRVRTWGGQSHDIGLGITVDAQGNACVAGVFELTVNFNPDGLDEHTSNGNRDAFLWIGNY